MSLTTNLSVSPYFDDFDENKGFYRILFKPGVSVQVRELNQLQSIFQNQIEKFGSNIYKSGSIISGVNFSFNDQYNFVRISDLDINGVPTIPGAYVNMFVESESTGVRARILEGFDGSEQAYPDTKTLYIDYTAGGSNFQTTSFSNNEIVKITNANNSIFAVSVINGGDGFSNSDTVIFTNALRVDPLTGSFSVGDTILQANNSRGIITGISNAYFGNTTLVINVKPLDTDLVANPNNVKYWEFDSNTSIINSSNSATGKVISSIGRNAIAQPITDAVGFVDSIIVTNIGYGYTILPHVSIKPTNTNANISDFDALAINYAARIRVPSTTDASGVGYSMSVTEGYIYQKGFFVKVQNQSVVVSKHNNQPNNVSVVFQTEESIVNSNIDFTLFDNATGQPNLKAPGADRIKLAPLLAVISTDDANSSDEYYSLVDFNEGKPYKQNRYTAYNEINNELARRTSDESGDYVTDEFVTTTRSVVTTNAAAEASQISIVVDPGKAYISGYRVETVDNYFETVNSGIDTGTTNNSVVSLNYGNYVRINELGGSFQFQFGQPVTFYDTKREYITGYSELTLPLSITPNTSGVNATSDTILLTTANTYLSVNDKIYYSRPVGETAIAGLVSNTYYFVTFANTTQFAISSTLGGANLNITEANTSPRILHSVKVDPTGVTYAGNPIASARVRSMMLESGTPGTNTAIYKMYLFNTTTQSGKNFKDAKSVFFTSANTNGVADLYLEQDLVTGANVAVIKSPENSKLIFSSGINTTLLNANNVNYRYRTSNNTIVLANTGLSTINYSTVANEFFPYSGTLSSSQLFDINVVPATDIISSAARSGTITTSYTSNTVSGSGSSFLSDFRVGDYVYLESNTTSKTINPSTDVQSSNDFIVVASNPFLENDEILYIVSAGNTAIANLSNNSYYYAFNANNSGFKLVSSIGNTTPINIAAGSGEIGHTFSTSNAHSSAKKIVLVSNNTSMQLDSNVGFTAASATSYRFYPKNIVIPFGTRDGLTANVDVNQNILTLNVGFATRGTSSATTVTSYNIERRNITPGTKIAKRNIIVKINVSENAGSYNGPWCLGCPDIFRLTKVTLSDALNNVVADVTNNFYIDHNQNPDFYDLGYLYKDPKSSLTLNAQCTLDVIFDAFTVSTPGYYITPSYVSANSTQQFVNDGKFYEELGSSINTHEIPELFSNRNGYFDLLNTVDFRPRALPTINLDATTIDEQFSMDNINTITGVISNTYELSISNYNPSSTVTFYDGTPTTDFKFPVPDSTFESKLTFYLPRIDSVMVRKTGEIDIVKGVSAKIPSVTNKPVDTILVGNMFIPDYPTISKNPNNRLLKILNKRMASESYSNRRLSRKIVNNLMTSNDKISAQPKGYNMADIGNLERRIKDLEYYVSLSALETSVSSLVIPSSISQSFDRFKYGFFVDDFSSSTFSDISNPEYSASRAFNDLYPLAENINLQHGSKRNYSLGMVGEQPVVIQDTATYLTLPEPCVVDTNVPIAVTQLVRQQQNPYEADAAIDTYIAPKFTQFNSTGVLYFYTYGAPVKIDILQIGVSLASTTDAVALTNDDITVMKELSFFKDSDVVLTTNAPTIASGYASGSGKIVFSHVPSAGRQYVIKTTKGTNARKWRYMLEYPVDTQEFIDCGYDTSPTQATTTTSTTTTTTTTTTTVTTPSTTTTASTASTASTTSTGSTTASTTAFSTNGLYLKGTSMPTSGSTLPYDTRKWTEPGNITCIDLADNFNFGSWTAIKANVTEYELDTVTDRWKTIYISNETVAAGIRKKLYDTSNIYYRLDNGTGATLVGIIHDLYVTLFNRLPELSGVAFWVHQIVTGKMTFSEVESYFSTCVTAIMTRWGLTSPNQILFQYNISTDYVSSYTIPSVNSPTYPAAAPGEFKFIRDINESNNQQYLFENIYDSNSATKLRQYYRVNSTGNFVSQTEIFKISGENLLKGASQRIGRNIPSTELTKFIGALYGWYINQPNTAGVVLSGGLGRPPEIGGFIYYLNKYYTLGVTQEQIEYEFFRQPEPAAIKNGSYTQPNFATQTLMTVTSNALTSTLAAVATRVAAAVATVTPDTTLSSSGSVLDSSESLGTSNINNRLGDSTTGDYFSIPNSTVKLTAEDGGDSGTRFRGNDGQVYLYDTETGTYYARRED